MTTKKTKTKKKAKGMEFSRLRLEPGFLFTGVRNGKRHLLQVYSHGRLS